MAYGYARPMVGGCCGPRTRKQCSLRAPKPRLRRGSHVSNRTSPPSSPPAEWSSPTPEPSVVRTAGVLARTRHGVAVLWLSPPLRPPIWSSMRRQPAFTWNRTLSGLHYVPNHQFGASRLLGENSAGGTPAVRCRLGVRTALLAGCGDLHYRRNDRALHSLLVQSSARALRLRLREVEQPGAVEAVLGP